MSISDILNHMHHSPFDFYKDCPRCVSEKQEREGKKDTDVEKPD